jgi:hypothetical protein
MGIFFIEFSGLGIRFLATSRCGEITWRMGGVLIPLKDGYGS